MSVHEKNADREMISVFYQKAKEFHSADIQFSDESSNLENFTYFYKPLEWFLRDLGAPLLIHH
jgi:hypothetical protein